MKGTITALGSFLDRNIGRCPRCMKLAFISALAAWLLYAAALFVLPVGILRELAIVVPISLTTLWTAHAVTYAARVLAALWSEYLDTDQQVAVNDGSRVATRRNLLWVLATTTSIVGTATLWAPVPALAAGHPCGPDKVCPDDAPNCCSRTYGKCCNGNWACVPLGKCYASHSDALAACGQGTIWACS